MFKFFRKNKKVDSTAQVAATIHAIETMKEQDISNTQAVQETFDRDKIIALEKEKRKHFIETRISNIVRTFNRLTSLQEKLFLIEIHMLYKAEGWPELMERHGEIFRPYAEYIDFYEFQENAFLLDKALHSENKVITNDKVKRYLKEAGFNKVNLDARVYEKFKLLDPNHRHVLQREREHQAWEEKMLKIQNETIAERFIRQSYFSVEHIEGLNLHSLESFKVHVEEPPRILLESEVIAFKRDFSDWFLDIINEMKGIKGLNRRHQPPCSVLKERFQSWYEVQLEDVKMDIVGTLCDILNRFELLDHYEITKIIENFGYCLRDMTIRQAKNTILDVTYLFDLAEIKRLFNAQIDDLNLDEKVLIQNYTTDATMNFSS